MAAENGISIPFDGIPFLSAGYKIYHCHQGKDVDSHTKEKKAASFGRQGGDTFYI